MQRRNENFYASNCLSLCLYATHAYISLPIPGRLMLVVLLGLGSTGHPFGALSLVVREQLEHVRESSAGGRGRAGDLGLCGLSCSKHTQVVVAHARMHSGSLKLQACYKRGGWAATTAGPRRPPRRKRAGVAASEVQWAQRARQSAGGTLGRDNGAPSRNPEASEKCGCSRSL